MGRDWQLSYFRIKHGVLSALNNNKAGKGVGMEVGGDMVLLSDRVVRKGPTKKMIFERDEGAAYVAF